METEVPETCHIAQENGSPPETSAPVEHRVEVKEPIAAVRAASRKTRSKQIMRDMAVVGTCGCFGCLLISIYFASLCAIPSQYILIVFDFILSNR